MSRILAVEPDPERGRTLQRLVHDRVDAEVVVVASTEAAIAAMSEQAPDLILTSTLMSPPDDSRLTAHLKELRGARDLPVLIVPPVVDASQPPDGRSAWPRPFSRRRSSPPWPAYDADALGARIADALAQAQSARADRSVSVVSDSAMLSPLALGGADVWSDAALAETDLLDDCGLGIKRLRAHRWEQDALPWLSGVRMPWGLEVQLLNISSSGMLVESGSKLLPGSTAAFQLWGTNRNIMVPGRIVRSQVAVVDHLGVRYRAAAAFDRNVDLVAQGLATLKRCATGPKALADLLVQVVAELERGADAATLRATFEQGLQQIVTARAIQIRDVPAVSHDGESVYFTVPTDRVQSILQVTFEPSYQPQEEEFRLLKAAATLAGVVLQFENQSAAQAIARLTEGPGALGIR